MQPTALASPTSPLRGIIPIVFAFFDCNNQLDRNLMRRQMQVLCALQPPAVALLGLATEVNKLSPQERRLVIDWAVEDAGGAVPLVVTVAGNTPAEQTALAEYACQAGASSLVLQPPAKAAAEAAVQQGQAASTEAYCLDFFQQVLSATPLPCGIQNAPEYLGVGLSPEAIVDLAQRCANFQMLKAEGPSVQVQTVIAALQGRLPVFNGRGGQELVDNLRAGCAGLIVAPDTFDWQQRVYAAYQSGNEAAAEQAYQQVLPAIVFVMQSLDTLLCYGKRIAAQRMGMEASAVYDRAPGLLPTGFGLAAAGRFARRLGPLGCLDS